MSLSPDASNWRTTELTIRSIRSSWIGLLRMDIRIDLASLSRSNGTRRPSDLTTVSSRNCTRSIVVKRWPQLPQKRRRRIAPLSSVGRLSFTWVSSEPQNGQRIVDLPRPVQREAGAQLLHPSTYRLFYHRVGAIIGPTEA